MIYRAEISTQRLGPAIIGHFDSEEEAQHAIEQACEEGYWYYQGSAWRYLTARVIEDGLVREIEDDEDVELGLIGRLGSVYSATTETDAPPEPEGEVEPDSADEPEDGEDLSDNVARVVGILADDDLPSAEEEPNLYTTDGLLKVSVLSDMAETQITSAERDEAYAYIERHSEA